MPRDAEVPSQEPASSGDVQFPQERGALYDLPKISSNDLIGEVIDILGFYGPFKSSFTSESGKEKHYVVFRFKAHSPLKYTNAEGVKSTLAPGEEATSTGSAVRVIERLKKAASTGDEGEEQVFSPALRALFTEEKTAQGFKVRTLKAPPSDWTP